MPKGEIKVEGVGASRDPPIARDRGALYIIYYRCGPALFGFCDCDESIRDKLHEMVVHTIRHMAETEGETKYADETTEVVVMASVDSMADPEATFVLINSNPARLVPLMQMFEDIHAGLTTPPHVHTMKATIHQDGIGVAGRCDYPGYPFEGMSIDLQNVSCIKRYMEGRRDYVLTANRPIVAVSNPDAAEDPDAAD